MILLSETGKHEICRYIRKGTGMFVEVGKGDTSPPFNQVLELLLAKEEYLAFAPNTAETRMMINILSLKFPVLRVYSVIYLLLIFLHYIFL